MVRSNQQAQSESERERAHTARKEKARVLIERINRQSGETVEDPPRVEQKTEHDKQKQLVNFSGKGAAYMPSKDDGISKAEAKDTVKVYMKGKRRG